jgi:DNA-binding IclR family transcriptional regulator
MIQVINRALHILEFVATNKNEPIQLYKIAEHAGLSQPTTANIVKTLLDKGYLEQLGRKKGYRLGIAAYQLTGNPSYQQNLINAAREPMEELTKQLNETTILAMIQNNKRVILHTVECNHVLIVKAIPEDDIYNTSSGKLMMAYLDVKELDKLIKAIGLPAKNVWEGVESRETLDKMIKKIKQEEFVQTYSDYHTVGFAVPIFKDKIVVAALSIYMPVSRYNDLHKEKINKFIKRTTKLITHNLEGND